MTTHRVIRPMRNISWDVVQALTAFKSQDVFTILDILDLVLLNGDDRVRVRKAISCSFCRLVRKGEIFDTGARRSGLKLFRKTELTDNTINVSFVENEMDKKGRGEPVCGADCFAKKVSEYMIAMGKRNDELERKFGEAVRLNEELSKIIEEKDMIITERQMQVADLKKARVDVKDMFNIENYGRYPSMPLRPDACD